MKMKKLTAVLLSLVMLLSMGSMGAVAAETIEPLTTPVPEVGDTVPMTPKIPSKDAKTVSGGYAPLTEEYLAELDGILKVNPVDSTDSAPSEIMPFAATWQPVDPMVTYFAQSQSNRCVAAATRTMLYFLTGTNYAESTVWTNVYISQLGGANVASAAVYINKEQKDVELGIQTSRTKTQFKDDMYRSIVTKNVPVLIGIAETTSNGWPYDLPGHAITIYSILSDKSEVAICDPWAGFASDSANRWYDRSIDKLYSAYTSTNGYTWPV